MTVTTLADPVALAAAVNAGTVAPDFGVGAAHRAIAARNDTLNALVDVDPAVTEQQLGDLRRRLNAGERPPLAGVPVAVKDHFQVEGWRCTEGSTLYRDRIAERDEPVIARLRRAGAILLGRSNMSEFGCKGVTTNLLYGPTRHPLDERLTPGGSSGGAASAVAGGLVPLALASDGGGSVRRPAAHVGIVGFKPSTGAIADPRDFSHTSVFGTMARSVAGAALMFEALAGPDPHDPVALPLPAHSGKPLSEMRVAWSPRLGLDVPVDDDITQTLVLTIEQFRAAGLRIETADPRWPAGATEEALMPIQHAGLAAAFGGRWRTSPELFDPDIGVQIESGLKLTGVDVSRAHGMSLGIARAAAAFFASGFDLLLSPTAPCPAWPLDRLGPDRIGGVPVGPRAHAVFTPFFNHAFCPAISIPTGTTLEGLPIGLQIAGPRFADWTLLRAAAEIEALLRNLS